MKPCKHGHPASESYRNTRGDRICRMCLKARNTAAYERSTDTGRTGKGFIDRLATEPVGVR